MPNLEGSFNYTNFRKCQNKSLSTMTEWKPNQHIVSNQTEWPELQHIERQQSVESWSHRTMYISDHHSQCYPLIPCSIHNYICIDFTNLSGGVHEHSLPSLDNPFNARNSPQQHFSYGSLFFKHKTLVHQKLTPQQFSPMRSLIKSIMLHSRSPSLTICLIF